MSVLFHCYLLGGKYGVRIKLKINGRIFGTALMIMLGNGSVTFN